jgi:hypothetical protein
MQVAILISKPCSRIRAPRLSHLQRSASFVFSKLPTLSELLATYFKPLSKLTSQDIELVISLLKRADFKCMHLSFYYGKLGTFSHVRKTRNIYLIQGTENWTSTRDLRELRQVPEFIDPRFRENKPKTLVFSHWKRALWARFRENWVYNFGQGGSKRKTGDRGRETSDRDVRQETVYVRLIHTGKGEEGKVEPERRL